MARFHLREDGTPGPCTAQLGNCPLGSRESEHYASAESARWAYEQSQISSFGELLGQTALKEQGLRKRFARSVEAFCEITDDWDSDRSRQFLADAELYNVDDDELADWLRQESYSALAGSIYDFALETGHPIAIDDDSLAEFEYASQVGTYRVSSEPVGTVGGLIEVTTVKDSNGAELYRSEDNSSLATDEGHNAGVKWAQQRFRGSATPLN